MCQRLLHENIIKLRNKLLDHNKFVLLELSKVFDSIPQDRSTVELHAYRLSIHVVVFFYFYEKLYNQIFRINSTYSVS